MQEKRVKLMQAEWGQHSLVLQRIDGVVALACSSPLKEGQIIAPQRVVLRPAERLDQLPLG
eukprot:3634899-Lingulodinium_polyedra.AAC.1